MKKQKNMTLKQKDFCENKMRFAPIRIDAQQYFGIYEINKNIYQKALPKVVDFKKQIIEKC